MNVIGAVCFHYVYKKNALALNRYDAESPMLKWRKFESHLIADILLEIFIAGWNIVDKKSRFYESHKCMIIDFMRKYHRLTNISNGDMSFTLWRVPRALRLQVARVFWLLCHRNISDTFSKLIWIKFQSTGIDPSFVLILSRFFAIFGWELK